MDSIFGFSFDPSGGIRSPFDRIISDLSKTDTPILSVDSPSGWDVNLGPIDENSINPQVLISLSGGQFFFKKVDY